MGKPFGLTVLTAALAVAAAMPASAQEKVLRIGMTAADIPRTLGQPDQGFEGNRFTGIPMYDALTQWDLTKATAPSTVIPGLATSWAVDANDKTKWVFKLRPGVKFHDGSAVNADAIVWNVQKVLDKDAPHSLSEIAKFTGYKLSGLKTIFNKGIGAFKTNPASVRPTVSSAEQWAQARVYSAVMGG